MSDKAKISDRRAEMEIMELYYINKYKPKYNIANKYDEDLLLQIDNGKEWTSYTGSLFKEENE